MTERTTYHWLEFDWRPLKDGLHDSGYRFLRVRGAKWDRKNSEIEYDELHQWADHITLMGPVNIDVTRDGVIRIMPWWGNAGEHGWVNQYGHRFFGSDAMFDPSDWERAISMMRNYKRVEDEVRDVRPR